MKPKGRLVEQSLSALNLLRTVLVFECQSVYFLKMRGIAFSPS